MRIQGIFQSYAQVSCETRILLLSPDAIRHLQLILSKMKFRLYAGIDGIVLEV